MLLEVKKEQNELSVTIDIKPEELFIAMAVNDKLRVLISKAYMMSITLPTKVTKA